MLVRCACGYDVDMNAQHCPSCGRPRPGAGAGALIFLTIAVAILVSAFLLPGTLVIWPLTGDLSSAFKTALYSGQAWLGSGAFWLIMFVGLRSPKPFLFGLLVPTALLAGGMVVNLSFYAGTLTPLAEVPPTASIAPPTTAENPPSDPLSQHLEPTKEPRDSVGPQVTSLAPKTTVPPKAVEQPRPEPLNDGPTDAALPPTGATRKTITIDNFKDDNYVICLVEGYVTLDGTFIRHGTQTFYFDREMTTKGRTVQWEHGIRHGPDLEWHRNGLKRSEFMAVRGQIHGTGRQWHDNGQLYCETKYSFGTMTGSRSWSRDGKSEGN